MGLTLLNVIVLAIVVFVNGLTDAPNAIATTVTTKSMTLKQAVVLSSVMNFLGVSISYVIKPAVVSNILQIFSFNDNERNIQTALCSAMFSVAVWAVTAWIFGIPTSESHALLAALAGAELAISNGRITHFAGIWLIIINGIIISSAIGFGVAAILSSVLNRKSKQINVGNAVLHLQKILSALLSFLHGAQDGQKMIGILLLILQNTSFSLFAEYISVIFCSLVMAFGTACSGRKIIDTIGRDLFLPNRVQALSTDVASCIGIALSTYAGLPVSTTTTKTMAIIGASMSDRSQCFNTKTAVNVIMAWILTLPVCCFLGFAITRILLFTAS